MDLLKERERLVAELAELDRKILEAIKAGEIEGKPWEHEG